MKDFKFQKMQSGICIIFLFLFSVVGSFILGQDKEIVVNYKIQPPKVEKIKIATDEKGEKTAAFDRIRIEDAYNYGEPGEPFLPRKTARILLPPGYEVKSIKVETGQEIQVKGEVFIEPAQEPIPASQKKFKYSEPNPKIYQSGRSLPESIFFKPRYQGFRGFNIVFIEFTPLKYLPDKQALFYYESLKFILEIAPKKETKGTSDLRKKDLDFEKVKTMIDNPDGIEYYKNIEQMNTPTPTTLPAGDWDMLIVTNSQLKPTFNSYALWRTHMRGIRTIVYDIAWVLANYQGYDSAEKLRNFIIDAYATWGIDYVLLGGDVEIIPYRKLYSQVYNEYIPSDLYFAGLDGTWDNNNNHIYGEGVGTPGDEADLFAEVYVGRAPVNTAPEANNFCNKIRNYEQSNLSTYRCDWLFFATNLSSITFGGSYKDDTQTKELPPSLNLNITKVYENLGGNRNQVINALNAGQRVGNSCGHGNTNSFGMINSTDVDNLTNTEYSLIYTWACWTNAFDQVDAIGEHFLYTPHGAFGFIGNSRYGWYYNNGDASGPSHDFDLKFYHALIAEETPRLGKAFQNSKEVFNGSASWVYRWITYALNLMGDPSTLLRLKSDIWIKTNNLDNGSIPCPGFPYTSPDIAVDSPADGSWQTPSPFIIHENPQALHKNRIYVRVRNIGCADAYNVTVKVYWADPSLSIPWPAGWNLIGSSAVTSVPHGGEITAPYIEWTPSASTPNHPCLFATVECPSDPISVYKPKYDNNVAQKNVNIIPLPPFVMELKPLTKEFFLNPPTEKGKRTLTIRVKDVPQKLNIKLLIPPGIKAEITADNNLFKLIKRKTGMLQVEVDSTTIIRNKNILTLVRGFQCDKKEKISISFTPAPGFNVKLKTQFTVSITEELNGEVIGGIDYIFQ